MRVIVGSTSESGASEQLRQLLFDLDVQAGTSEEARPARMRAPFPQLALDRLDDLRVKVEAQVVAGREVTEPLVPDADAAPADLVDDGVHHGMRHSQAFEVLPALVAACSLRAGVETVTGAGLQLERGRRAGTHATGSVVRLSTSESTGVTGSEDSSSSTCSTRSGFAK